MNRIFKSAPSSELVCRMKKLSIFLAFLVCVLISCETTRYVPAPITEKMAKKNDGQHIGQTATLLEGRTLFVHRCIECHTLPMVWHYRTDDWPKLVDSMSKRASLKPTERDAILAYIIAARGAEM
jgi:hypothetical protein